jgi:hypothetical protein
MKRFLTLKFFIELAASVFTLTGIYVGSTTTVGAICYLIALVFWFWMMYREKMWGLAPLNIATAVIASYNLWSSL